MSSIANAIGALLVKFTGDSSGFTQATGEAEKSLDSLASKLPNLSGGLGGLGGAMDKFSAQAIGLGAKLAGGLGLLSIGSTALAVAEKFEQADARMARATGLAGASLAQLEQSARNVYAKSAASLDTITAAMTIMEQRTGTTGPALEKLTGSLIGLSKVANEDVGSLGGLVTRVFGDWSIATNDQAKAMDFLRVVAQQTGTTVSRLSESVVYAGAPLRELGFSFQQTAALIGKFEKEGVNTELVLGGMKAALAKFAESGGDAGAKWRIFVKDVESGRKTMEDVIPLVGIKRAVDLFRAIKEGRFDIDDTVKSFEDMAAKGGGAIKTLSGEWTKLKHEFEVGVLEPIGKPIVESALAAIKALHDLNSVFLVTKALFAVGTGQTTKTNFDLSSVLPIDLSKLSSGEQGEKAKAAMKSTEDAAKELDKALRLLKVSHDNLFDTVSKLQPAYALLVGAFERGKISAVDLWQASVTLADAQFRAQNGAFELSLAMDKAEIQGHAFAKSMDESHDSMVAYSQSTIEITDKLSPMLHAYEILHARLNEILGDLTANTVATNALADATSQVAEGIQQYKDFKDAAHSFGTTFQEDLDANVEAAKKLYDTIRQGNANGGNSYHDVISAERAWLQAMKDAGTATAEQNARLNQLNSTLDGHSSKIKVARDSWLDMTKRVHDALVNDLARGLTDVITGTGKVSDAFKKLGTDIVDIIVHKIIADGIQKLLNSLASVDGLIGKVAKSLGGLASGIATPTFSGAQVPGIGNVPGGVQTLPTNPGDLGSTVSSVVGSSITGMVGAVSGVVSAVSGVIGNFQFAAMNKSLDLIEASTRYAWITLGQGSESIASYVKQEWMIQNDWIKYQKDWLHAAWVELLDDQQAMLKAIAGLKLGNVGTLVNNQPVTISLDATNALLSRIADSAAYIADSIRSALAATATSVTELATASAAPFGAAAGGNVTLHIAPGAIVVQGASDPRETADIVLREIPRRFKQFSSAYAPGR